MGDPFYLKFLEILQSAPKNKDVMHRGDGHVTLFTASGVIYGM